MEINVLTLHKLVKATPRSVHVIIKASTKDKSMCFLSVYLLVDAIIELGMGSVAVWSPETIG